MNETKEVAATDYRWLARWNLSDRSAQGWPFYAPCSDVVVFGEPHTVATNGHVLFILPPGHGETTDADGAHAKQLEPVLAAWPKEAPRQFDVCALKAALGVVKPWDAPCTRCADTGLVPCERCDETGVRTCTCDCGDEHDTQCGECGGTKRASCKKCGVPSGMKADSLIIHLFGVGHFNGKLLAAALQYLPDDGMATFAQDAPDKPAVFEHERWTLLVMPVRHDPGSSRPVIHFPAITA